MPINKLAKKRGKAKVKISDKREAAMKKIEDCYSEEFDVKMSIIQELIPLGLQAIAEELQNEVKQLAGPKHSREANNVRWGKQNGSAYLRDQKFPIKVPRVRNLQANKEVPLNTYQRLQQPFNDNSDVMRRLLHGLSTHKYHESSSLSAEAFGISASNLSKKFKKNSTEKLKELQTRHLTQYDIVAIFIDAKRYAGDGIIVALGVTMDGKKIVLGVEHIHSENARAIGQWLDRLIERGLKFEEGILFIVDGSKGLSKAIKQKFSMYCLIQRCCWHKRENVVAYLDKPQATIARRRLQDAYSKTTYKEAKAALTKLHKELETINVSAANSLSEGLEETLQIHQLGLSSELSKSLSTTNCIEGLMSQIGSYTDKVDRWHNSDQLLRWTGSSLMDIEPRLRRIKGYGYLKVLKYKLQEIVKARTAEKPAVSVQKLVEIK
ncbi:MAG: transposase [Candidatus Omnitrophica bacterium]|nr:transposase [Candidatus Omnitrophota bacterium]